MTTTTTQRTLWQTATTLVCFHCGVTATRYANRRGLVVWRCEEHDRREAQQQVIEVRAALARWQVERTTFRDEDDE